MDRRGVLVVPACITQVGHFILVLGSAQQL